MGTKLAVDPASVEGDEAAVVHEHRNPYGSRRGEQIRKNTHVKPVDGPTTKSQVTWIMEPSWELSGKTRWMTLSVCLAALEKMTPKLPKIDRRRNEPQKMKISLVMGEPLRVHLPPSSFRTIGPAVTERTKRQNKLAVHPIGKSKRKTPKQNTLTINKPPLTFKTPPQKDTEKTPQAKTNPHRGTPPVCAKPRPIALTHTQREGLWRKEEFGLNWEYRRSIGHPAVQLAPFRFRFSPTFAFTRRKPRPHTEGKGEVRNVQ